MLRLRLRFLFHVVASVAAVMVSAARVEAGVVYDSTAAEAAGSAQLSTNGVSSWNYGAQQFNSGTNNQLAAVSLLVNRVGTGGTYSIELWSNTVVSGTAVPNALVATLGSGSTSTLQSLTPNLVTLNPGTAISSNTDYWVVFNATSVGPGQANWFYTADFTGTGVASTGYFKTNDGDGWNEAYGEYRGIMSVTAAAVPEPTTYALAAIGLGIAGFVRARRRKAGS